MKGFGKIKFKQLAIWVPKPEKAMKMADIVFPHSIPMKDELLMDGQIDGWEVDGFPLELSYLFNLIPDVEIEYIVPEGDHWLSERIALGKPFISHLGAYCTIAEINECIAESHEMGVEIIQKTISHSHTNKRIAGPIREYFDVVFGTELMIGFNVKLTAKADGHSLEVLS